MTKSFFNETYFFMNNFFPFSCHCFTCVLKYTLALQIKESLKTKGQKKKKKKAEVIIFKRNFEVKDD